MSVRCPQTNLQIRIIKKKSLRGRKDFQCRYVYQYQEILHEDPIGNAPTSCIPCKQQRDPYDWNERHEQILKMNKESNPEVLMIGNSITHYWSGEPLASQQHGKTSWKNLFKDTKVRNLGFGWDKTENVLWRIYHDELDGYAAKTIFLLIGTNNLPFNTDEEVVEGIYEVVKAIHFRQPQAKLCVIGILPRNGMEARVSKVNKALQNKLKTEEISYINVASKLTDKKGLIIPTLFLDGLHPNEQGYERIAEVLRIHL